MRDRTSVDATEQCGVERASLEEAHHEIGTTSTVLRLHVELARRALQEERVSGKLAERIDGHLLELDAAIDRLQRFARLLRAWHARSLLAPEPPVSDDLLVVQEIVRQSVMAATEEGDDAKFDAHNPIREAAVEHLDAAEALAAVGPFSRDPVIVRSQEAEPRPERTALRRTDPPGR